MKPYIYIGLDIATTTGIAIYNPMNFKAEVVQYKGEPVQLLGFLKTYVLHGSYHDSTFVLELPSSFRNAIVTRSLLTRYGFIKYSLMDYNYLPVEVNLNSVRSYFQCKNKGEVKSYFKKMYRGKKTFTDNHSDALAVAIYQSVMDGFDYSPLRLQITELETR